MAWVSRQRDQLQLFVTRCLDFEQWLEWPDKPPYIPASATDILALLDTTLAALFKLDVPLHSDVVRQHLDMLGQCCQQYGVAVAARLNDPDQVVQPPMPLTRYKEALSARAETDEHICRCAQRLHSSRFHIQHGLVQDVAGVQPSCTLPCCICSSVVWNV